MSAVPSQSVYLKSLGLAGYWTQKVVSENVIKDECHICKKKKCASGPTHEWPSINPHVYSF